MRCNWPQKLRVVCIQDNGRSQTLTARAAGLELDLLSGRSDQCPSCPCAHQALALSASVLIPFQADNADTQKTRRPPQPVCIRLAEPLFMKSAHVFLPHSTELAALPPLCTTRMHTSRMAVWVPLYGEAVQLSCTASTHVRKHKRQNLDRRQKKVYCSCRPKVPQTACLRLLGAHKEVGELLVRVRHVASVLPEVGGEVAAHKPE